MFDFELPHQFSVTVFGLQLIGDVVAESLLLLGIMEQVCWWVCISNVHPLNSIRCEKGSKYRHTLGK